MSSQGLATTNDTQQDDHDGDHQQNMDKAADGSRTDQTDQPENYEYYCNGIEHVDFLSSYGSLWNARYSNVKLPFISLATWAAII